ncbi:MAG: nuclear transport factor 2 family protein [Sphingomonadales bacterium]|nr:nuclear transport factor 2 family protein [Sphingomonadales bacterium]
MSASPRKQAAARLLAAAGQGDMATVAALIGDDFVLEQMVRDPETHTSAAGTAYDRATYLGFLGAVLAMTRDGMNLTIDAMLEEGDEIAVFGTSNAVSPSGWGYRNAYCWRLAFRGERITRMTEYFDTALGNRLLAG